MAFIIQIDLGWNSFCLGNSGETKMNEKGGFYLCIFNYLFLQYFESGECSLL